MDIETNKTEFINLLRNVYVAKQNNLETYAPLLESFDVSNEDLSIREDVLKQYSFGDRAFWEIICQSLKHNGILRSFENPEIVMHTHFKESPRHIRLSTKLGELRKKLPHNYYPVNLNIKKFSKNEIEKYNGVAGKMEKITAELDRLETHFMSNYVHLFVVDEKVLCRDETSSINQCCKIDDDYLYLINPSSKEQIPVGDPNQLIGVRILENLARIYPKPRKLLDLYNELTVRGKNKEPKQQKKWVSNSLGKVYVENTDLKKKITILYPSRDLSVLLHFKDPKRGNQ